MSAWLTSDVHVSALVQQACIEGLIDWKEADIWWNRAKWQNHYALLCRYGDELPAENAEDLECRRTTVEAELHPAKVFDLWRCWNYQCAEFEGYDKTAVSILLEGLSTVLVYKYPEFFDAHDNGDGGFYYDSKIETTWGITDWDEVIWVKEHAS